MTCMDTQRMIMPFINKELDLDDLEKFLNHIRSCPICMEELEVYYVLLSSMKHLDKDQELSNDYQKDLMNLINEIEHHITNKKKVHTRKRVSLFIVITVIALTTSFRVGEYVVEDVLYKVTESNFMPDELALIRKKDFPEGVESQLSDIYLYLREQDLEDASKMYEYYDTTIWKNMNIEKEFGSFTSIPDWTLLHY